LFCTVALFFPKIKVKAKDKWKTSALKLLSNVNKFIDDIRNYNKENIKPSIIKKVKKAMKSPH
jgi:hypothetical protein